jgi:hypothetical protein
MNRFCKLLLALAMVSVAANATVIGSFATAGSGQVTVSLTAITFTPSTDNIFVASPTASNLTYGAGTHLALLTLGTIQNLTNPALPSVIDNFMTFNGTPLDFKLEAVGPGDLTDPHDCSQATSNGKSCSPLLPGNLVSPIILTYNNGGTVVQMFMSGEVSDNGGATWSKWTGQLSATLTATLDQITTPSGASVAPTPQNIISYFIANPTGAITSSHSGTFTASVVPEPATLVFVGSGMVLVGLLRRRRRS